MTDIVFTQNAATVSQIENHLKSCNAAFLQELSARISIYNYCNKLHDKSFRFEIWSGQNLTGLLAVYFNSNDFSFITNISVSETHMGHGIASILMAQGIEKAKLENSSGMKLEVSKNNLSALTFYDKFQFVQYDQSDVSYFLSLTF